MSRCEEQEAVMKAQSAQLDENHWVRNRRSWALGLLWFMLFTSVTSFAFIHGHQEDSPEQVVMNDVESWMIIDEQGIIRNLSFPMAHLLGCYPPQLVGQPLACLLPEKYKQRHYDAFQQAMHIRKRGVFVVKATIMSYDGKREIPVEVRARVFSTPKGVFGKASINPTSEIVAVTPIKE